MPGKIDDGDPNSVEVGTRFRSNVAGFITGARFYKGAANTGTHIAKLWTNAGALLGSATFAGETASGWQETAFTTPIPITANTTYLISYHANNGHYSSQAQYFAAGGVTNGPLTALRDGADGANGVYQYGASVFPTQTYQSEGYFVDVVFNTTNGPDITAPTVTSATPVVGVSGIPIGTNVRVSFNETMNATTINTNTVQLRDGSNNLVPAAVTYDAATRTATLDPTSPLPYLTIYTATVKGGATDPRVKDTAGNALAGDHVWSFTTAAPPPPPPTEGPGGPVLVVTSSANPFSTYLAEILRTEGLNAFTTADLTTVNAGTLTSYDVVTPRRDAADRRPGHDVLGLGHGRRQPDRDAARQEAGAAARPHRRRHHAGRGLPARQHRRRAGRGHRQPDDPVPRHRGSLHAERRHVRGDAVFERDDRHHESRGHDAHGGQRQCGRLHLRPRAFGGAHPPGQPGVVGPGTRRTDADPQRRSLLRRQGGRHPA